MQIVLIQAEIEKAIRNYVNSIVKVAEGVDIVIDLKSTRGDTGFTANIDLVEAGADRAPTPTPAPTPKVAAPKVSVENSDELAAKAKAAEAEAKKKAEAEAAEQAALKQEQERSAAASIEATEAEGSAEPPFEPDTKEEAPAITTTATEPEASEQPAAPRKPLFGRTNAALNA
jgi:translation initiation factor IF-2